MKRILFRVLGVLVLAGLGVGGYFLYASLTREPLLTYRTAKVERGSVASRVSATGTLSAHVTVQVGSQVSGRLQQITVDFNSPVKKGQLLAKIDPQIFQAALSQSRANAFAAQGNLAKAKAQALDAERQLARAKALHADGLSSQADLDTAEANDAVAKAGIEAAKGAVEQARAGMEQAQINLAYTDIFSPIDGVVISRNVDVGQTVAASLQAPTLFTLAEDLRRMQVDTSVTEGDVGKLKPGMPASFVVDAYPSQRFQGSIRQIRNSPTSVQNVVTYDAVIDVENPDLKLKPGMTANVTVVWAEKDDVLVVPNAALRFRPPAALASSAPSASASGRWGGSGAGSGSGRGRRSRDAGAPSGAPPGPAPGGSAPVIPASASAGGIPAPPGSAPAAGGGGGDAPADRRTMWVLRGARPEQIRVRTGLTDGSLTEILDGDLHEGDAVVIEALSGDEPAPAASTKPPGGSSQSPRLRF